MQGGGADDAGRYVHLHIWQSLRIHYQGQFLRSLVDCYLCVGGPCFLHLWLQKSHCSALNMEAAGLLESVTVYRNAQCQITEGCDLQFK
jgi:hypothetical protein